MKKIFLIVLVFVSVVYANSIVDKLYNNAKTTYSVDEALKIIEQQDDKENAQIANKILQEQQFEKQHPFIANAPLTNDIAKSFIDTGKFIDDSFSKVAGLADPYFKQTDQNNPVYKYAENVGKAQQMFPNRYDQLTGLIAWIIDIVILLVLFKIITKMTLKVRALF